MKKFCLIISIIFLFIGFVVGYNVPMDISVSLYEGPNMKLTRNVEISVGRSYDYTFGFSNTMIRIKCKKK